MKRRWLLVPLMIVVIVAALIVWRWEDVDMQIAPKAVLSDALTEVYGKLQERSQGSPVWILLSGYDESGRNTLELDLTTTDSLLGVIDYDMSVQTNLPENRVSGVGTVTTGGSALDVSIYLDSNFMALTSDDLLDSGYYGITYDTFSEDIRSFGLLKLLIPNTAINSWDASIRSIQSFMSRSYALPQIPDITQEDIRLLMLAILALPCDKSEELITVNGSELTCTKLLYEASGAQVAEVLPYLLQGGSYADGSISAAFYLWEEALVMAEVKGISGEDWAQYAAVLGQDAAADDLTVRAEWTENGASRSLDLLIATSREGECLSETVQLNDTVISYDWYNATGDMTLRLANKNPIQLKLTEGENGFRIETRDIFELLGIQTEKTADCAMLVQKGSDVITPEYKNMDQWSFDDLLVLLRGIGAIIGLNTR